MKLEDYIRAIPDFPKKGILFRDITTLLSEEKAFRKSINDLAKMLKGKKIDYIVSAEARGFIFGGALAYKLNCGFVPVRKPGKLPSKTYCHSYATGGTALALAKLVEKLGGAVEAITFLIELKELEGRKKMKKYPVYSLIKF